MKEPAWLHSARQEGVAFTCFPNSGRRYTITQFRNIVTYQLQGFPRTNLEIDQVLDKYQWNPKDDTILVRNSDLEDLTYSDESEMVSAEFEEFYNITLLNNPELPYEEAERIFARKHPGYRAVIKREISETNRVRRREERTDVKDMHGRDYLGRTRLKEMEKIRARDRKMDKKALGILEGKKPKKK